MAKFNVSIMVKDFVAIEIDAEDKDAAVHLADDCCEELSEQLGQIANMSFIVDGERIILLPYAEVCEIERA